MEVFTFLQVIFKTIVSGDSLCHCWFSMQIIVSDCTIDSFNASFTILIEGNPPTDVRVEAVELHVCVLDTKRAENLYCHEKTL